MEGKPPVVPLTKLMFTMPRRHKWAVSIAFSIPFAAIAFAFALGPAPEKALHAFYTDGAPLTGQEIVPIVIREISNKEMPRRTLAMQFLGTQHDRAALPALEAILGDETEHADARAIALEAISSIDRTRARQLAALHAARADHLGASAKALSN